MTFRYSIHYSPLMVFTQLFVLKCIQCEIYFSNWNFYSDLASYLYEYIHYSHFSWGTAVDSSGVVSGNYYTIFALPLSPFSFHISLVTHVSRSRVTSHNWRSVFIIYSLASDNQYIHCGSIWSVPLHLTLHNLPFNSHVSPLPSPTLRSHCALSLSLSLQLSLSLRVVLICA